MSEQPAAQALPRLIRRSRARLARYAVNRLADGTADRQAGNGPRGRGAATPQTGAGPARAAKYAPRQID
ncbi:hypothetical protein ACIP5Y_35890 [Nocardia sp. NPDC088792]|uniref:hypothetical protein n=1 Tax=Nocardia sp. NPDC088792 TaxID=3364332 RepID=UPI0037F7E964